MLILGVTPLSLGFDIIKNSPLVRGPLVMTASQTVASDDGDYVQVTGTSIPLKLAATNNTNFRLKN